MPAVSVIMVTHRDTPFLRPAIGSVLAQTFSDFELVLVDNGAGISADDLGPLGGDARLHWIRLPRNLGIPGGHNAGIAAARGEFITLLDHDDVMMPSRVERQVAVLRAQPAVGLVSSQAETIDADGRVTGPEFSLGEAESQDRYTQIATPVVTPAYSGRRALFARLPYRAELTLTADFDFLARAAEQVTFGRVPEVLLRYRRHRSQATQEGAAAIEHERGWIRLFTARRRAGKPENFAYATPPTLPGRAQSCLALGQQAIEENFYRLAAYQARRALVLARAPGEILRAVGLGWRAISRAEPSERRVTRRMFFSGPVRALDVR